MVIEKLRHVLIVSLAVAISWIGGGVFLKAKPQTVYPFANASLCIHGSRP